MKHPGACICVLGAAVLTAAGVARPAERITIDYPEDGSIFPPEITAPTFLFRDPAKSAATWRIEITFAGGAPGVRLQSPGERMKIGAIDPRCVSATNEPPKLTPQQADTRTWKPDPVTWEAIKRHSIERAATITISGLRDGEQGPAVSRGQVTIRTSTDPVGAPIFYRDVPLMPSDLEKGVIKPLAESALPLIAWRLRYAGEPQSRLLMEGLHTCANCHSFSQDGRTLGMDLDGPRSDKGMYGIVKLEPQTVIRNEDVVTWGSFRGELGGQLRVGFMSQVSPDGRFVATTIQGPDAGSQSPARRQSNYYVANFKDYRFLQVFYPTRGILAWYNRATQKLLPLPGADDPRFVQASAVWTPDGGSLIFARAEARDPYPEGAKPAGFANDPNETQIRYDLYRIPFNEGRGGRAEPIAGASGNGTSNTFPKVSPDGRWIVFVKCRNGQLMRPDSQLYIVPAQGGPARRMRCNTPLMNSWHSFSPNGRWLVFSSKSRSPYTQMFLTHVGENGDDSPPILIENTTAANRAVNIPEFVNMPPNGLLKIDAPAADFYRLFDRAWGLAEQGQFEPAIIAWKEALQLNPQDARAHYNLGISLARTGKFDEAIAHYQQALTANPDFAEVHHNLAVVLAWKGSVELAVTHFEKALKINPGLAEAHHSLGDAHYFLRGKPREAIACWRKALTLRPDHLIVLTRLAWVLSVSPDASIRNGAEALVLAKRAVEISGGGAAEVLDTLAAACAETRRFPEAVATAQQALRLAEQQNQTALVDALKARIALYRAGVPYRESPRPE